MTVYEDIKTLVGSLVEKEPESFSGVGEWASPWTKGTIQFRQRVKATCVYSVERWPGDIVEIGCYCGRTTSIFARIAEEHGRRVIAIDPWEVGMANCDGHEYGEFLEATKPWKDIIDVVRLPSQDLEAIAYLKERELCYALVDGWHDYEPCYSDIMACAHCNGIICVDDLLWNPDVERAFYDAQAETLRDLVRHELIKEGYLLP